MAKILYVHETGNYRHLIAIASSAIYWFLQDGSLGSTTPIKSFDYEASVLSVNSIGNTLIIVATDGIHYALWVDGGYKYLSQKPPFVEIAFSISDDYPENYSNGGIVTEGSVKGFREVFQQTTYSCNDVFDKVKISTSITDLLSENLNVLQLKKTSSPILHRASMHLSIEQTILLLVMDVSMQISLLDIAIECLMVP